ncbi:hypothetical protein, partial [Alteromonas sp. a30]|uniref:hypothetical protein n=1 Tax=Alteromonas sp. a30 TaxID=2730917 RepID=UPI002281CA90
CALSGCGSDSRIKSAKNQQAETAVAANNASNAVAAAAHNKVHGASQKGNGAKDSGKTTVTADKQQNNVDILNQGENNSGEGGNVSDNNQSKKKNPEPDPATIKDIVSPNQAWLNDGVVSSNENSVRISLSAFNDGIEHSAFDNAIDQIDRLWDGSGSSKKLIVDIRIVAEKSKANLIFTSCAEYGFCNTSSGKVSAYVTIGGDRQHVINWSPRASLSLDYAGDRYLTPTHEFGHALGLWHQKIRLMP